MKRTLIALCGALLLAVLAFSTTAQEMQKQPASKPKPAKPKPPMPTSDADIQKCIQDRFANAPSLKANPPSVSVSGGTAIIIGEAQNGGQKSGASRIAKVCGAKVVKNEMTMAVKKKV